MRFSSMFIIIASILHEFYWVWSRRIWRRRCDNIEPHFFDEHTMAHAIRLAIVALVLAGCGLKGPLTLPEPDVNTQKEQKK